MIRTILSYCTLLLCPLFLHAGTWQQGGTYQAIHHLLFAPDGKNIWCSYQDNTPDALAGRPYFSMFDIETGETEYTANSVFASSLANSETILITPDNTTLFAQYYTNTVQCYNVTTGTQQWSYTPSSPSLPALAVVDNGQNLLLMWKVDNVLHWEQRLTTNGTASAIGSIPDLATFTDFTLSPDGNVVAVYSTAYVEFRATHDGSLLSTVLFQSQERVRSVSFGSTGTVSLVYFTDKRVQIYETATGLPRTTMPTLTSEDTPLLYNNDSLLLLWRDDDTLATYDAFTGQGIAIHRQSNIYLPVFTHPTQPLLVLLADSHESSGGMPREVYTIFIANTQAKTIEQTFPAGRISRDNTASQNVPSAFSHTSTLLAVSPPEEHRTIVRRVQDGSWFCTLPTEGILAFAPDDSALLVANNDTLYEWDYIAQKLQAAHHIPIETIQSMHTSLYHPFVALVGDSSIVMWNSDTRKIVHTWQTSGELITHTRFSRWGNRCIVGTNDGTLLIWETTSGSLISTHRLPDSLTPYARYRYDISPNEQLLAVATTKGVVIKDIADDTVVHEIINLHLAFIAFPSNATLHSCMFSTDGKSLFTSASVHLENEGSTFSIKSTSIRAFSVESGQLLFDATLPVSAPIQALSPRSDHLFTLAYGNWTTCLQLPSTLVSVPSQEQAENLLLSATPNPFSQNTTIALALGGTTPANIIITDVRGRVVRRFSNLAPQQLLWWNGTDSSGKQLGCGVYYCTVEQSSTARYSTIVVKQ